MERFNAIGDLSEGYQKYRSFQELEKNKVFKVKKIEINTTKFGKKFSITFDKIDGIFHLPSRFDRLDEKEKNNLLKLKNFGLIYKGTKTVGKFKNQTPIINFVPIDVKNDYESTKKRSSSTPTKANMKKKIESWSDNDDDDDYDDPQAGPAPKRKHASSSSDLEDDSKILGSGKALKKKLPK